MLDVFFFEAFHEEAELIKKYLPENIKAGFAAETIQEYIKEQNNDKLPAKIISLRTQSKIPKNWEPNIQAILARATGYDQIKKYAPQIPCGHLPLYCSRAVAEQTMFLWMALLRKLKQQIKQFDNFKRDGLTGRECLAKNIAIFGVGNIGYEVYKIAHGLEMKAYGIDIVKKHNDINYISEEDALKKADIIICAMNLTEKNRNYFNYEKLKQAKPGVIFVNISRGEISPQEHILKLIEEDHLGGAALDVYNNEHIIGEGLRNNQKDHPEIKTILALKEKDNVILTPHNAFNTLESTNRKAKQSVEQVENFLKTGKFIWPIP